MTDNNTPAGGDNDQPYTFGLPVGYYVSTREHARLVLLRSRIEDACRHIGRRELQGRVIEWGYAKIHAPEVAA